MVAEPEVPTSMHDTVAARLTIARRELLDLGLRNSLINYRPLRSRGVEVVGESPAEVFRILVREGKRMSFQPAAEAREGEVLAQPEEPSPEEIAARQRDAHLQTREPSTQLQARLLQTFYAARTFIEEQGANILYLALGMLEWYEDDTSTEKRRAPIVLVPVSLERSNALDRFHLLYNGDDIGDNLSLSAKLLTEFAIETPTMPDVEDFDLEAFFDAFDAAVVSRPRWKVDRSAIALGFFSFGKFLMYRDLDLTIWPPEAQPAEHPLVRALLTPEGFNEPATQLTDDAFIDAVLKREEMHEVVDADSSQTLAIYDVNAGRNLVIQGPPGTGKSQTITNIIAEAIGRGKTVLFVAEKMAALEVVKRRLDAIGLGEACLELHSHKINKRTVLQELARTLELGRPRVTDLSSEIHLLDDYRARLNAYCEAVNLPVGESGVTPYHAYGEVVRQRQQSHEMNWPRLEIPGLASWTSLQFSRREAIAGELQARLEAMGVPVEHPFWGSQRTMLLPSDQAKLQNELHATQMALHTLRAAAGDLARLLGLTPPTDRREISMLQTAAERALSAPALAGIALDAPEWQSRTPAIRALTGAAGQLAAIRARQDGVVIPEAWAAPNLVEIRQGLAPYRDKWWRFLSGQYRRAKSSLAGLCTGSLPGSVDEQIALVDDLLDAQRQTQVIEQHAELGARLSGPHWQGPSSDWQQLHATSEWLIALHSDIATGQIPQGVLAYLSNPAPAESLTEASSQLNSEVTGWDRQLRALETFLEFDSARRFGDGASLSDQPLEVIETLLHDWTVRLSDLNEMIAFNVSAEACQREELGDLVRIAERWPEANRQLTSALRHAWFSVLLERALTERPALAQFDASSHEHVLARFQELDQQIFEYNRSRLAVEHWSRLPRHEGGGQLGTLRREFEKRSRHLPIRRLMERAGKAIQAIKPVFMMGPLSIATYIPPGSVTFDLVIFDEASQVKPVDAFGALVRGQQAVVVGDSRQLPPTSFFDTLIHTDESDEDQPTGDIESILGLFAAQNAPQRMLRWHYRSRHESLIAVSNREFYDSRLIVFPSPDAAREQAGLVYHYLPHTTYDRGGSRANRDEAATVAQAVMEHARTRPHLTLGVAAFSTAQTDAILTEVELLRRKDPSAEPFFAAHPHEPFFVKNLENVQGDERDVIYISVGYGRTADGYLTMNFGPLNADGGERRLNVLITRARLRCEVFTNLTADDIDLNRTNARGVVALKQFLHYAQTGLMDVPMESGLEAGSPFEEAVHRALTSAGYEVRQQVGSAGFFIDLAVVDPRKPGRYLLGIECDGANYHSARSARDRDRLRQQVLQRLGWRIHRIWSTDWFRNPDRELRRVIAAIEDALAQGEETPIPAPVSAATEIHRDDGPSDALPASGATPYAIANLRVSTGGRDLPDIPAATMSGWVAKVVEAESPVHVDEVARRITSAAGVSRAGSRIRAAIDIGITHAVRTGSVHRRGDFLWLPSMETPEVRDRGATNGTLRAIQAIAPEEIEQAVIRVVTDAYGMEREQIANAACRLLGFARLSDDIRQAIDVTTTRLLAAGRLREEGGHVVV